MPGDPVIADFGVDMHEVLPVTGAHIEELTGLGVIMFLLGGLLLLGGRRRRQDVPGG